ncbi:MAG: hypothetical protein H2063_09360 [Synechococcus sp.]|nr:hypothetical protein [Synechococcus sp.]
MSLRREAFQNRPNGLGGVLPKELTGQHDNGVPTPLFRGQRLVQLLVK